MLDCFMQQEAVLCAFSHTKQISDSSPSDIAAAVIKDCLEKTNLKIDDIDLLVSCSHTPDLNNPSLANSILAKLERYNIPGIELRQSTNAIVAALEFAISYITTGNAKCIVICATELLSRFFNGLQKEAIANLEIKRAKEACGDGCAAFLVLSKDFAKSKNISLPLMKGTALRHRAKENDIGAFWISHPSSSQFPLRLSRDDVVQGRHAPHLSVESFKLTAQDFLVSEFQEFLKEKKIETSSIKTIIHSSLPTVFKKFIPLLSLASEADVYDVADRFSFVGAAGLAIGLSEVISKSKGNIGRTLLLGLSSGPSLGFAILDEVRLG